MLVFEMGVWYNTRHLLGIDVADATIEKQASGLALRQDSFRNCPLGPGSELFR